LISGEHVPDRFGESAGEVDLGNFGAALFADSGLCALVAVTVGGGGAGVGGGLDERPAQVARSLRVLGRRMNKVYTGYDEVPLLEHNF
jgi:hypothetical protein